MLTKKVKKRIQILTFSLITLMLITLFVLSALNKNILYFKTPTDIFNSQNLNFSKSLRVGGMVKKNSIKVNNNEIKFVITDLKNEIMVTYQGTVPNLFLEGKGVIAEGKLMDKKFFIANRILAKHDENYIPPELKEMKK